MLSSQQLENSCTLSCALIRNADLSEVVHTSSFLLISTYTLDVQKDNSLCSLSHLIVLWHLQEGSTFQFPSSISPNLISVTFCFWTVTILEAHAYMLADSSIMFMKYIFLSFQNVMLTSFKLLFNKPSLFASGKVKTTFVMYCLFPFTIKKDIQPLSMPYNNLHPAHTLSIPQNFLICTEINIVILLVLKGCLYWLICS